MTEQEYVQRIRTSAEEYLSFIRGEIEGEQARNAIARWEHVKASISPRTAIVMCEAWLSGNDKLRHDLSEIPVLESSTKVTILPQPPERCTAVIAQGTQCHNRSISLGNNDLCTTHFLMSGRGKHIEKINSVSEFVERCVIPKKGAIIQAANLYSAYVSDCCERNVPHENLKQFGLAMADLGFRKNIGRIVVYVDVALLQLGQRKLRAKV